MAIDQGMEFGVSADNQPPAVTLAAGHFWCQPFRFGLQADHGQIDEFEQTGGELDADGQAVPTWCEEEN